MSINNTDYCEYFGFTREPFSIAPDPDLFYPSLQHESALSQLEYGASRQGGFMLLTGEVGTGKTTVTRLFLQSLPQETKTVTILNSSLNSAQLLKSICQALAVPLCAEQLEKANDDIVISTDALESYLYNFHQQKIKTIIVIEEAQNLSTQALEDLRLLTNFETDRTKLVTILLVGQPELLNTLAQQRLRQLQQRVIARAHLVELQLQDITNYVEHRINQVGGKEGLFSQHTLQRIFYHSHGVPRRINILTEKALWNNYIAKQTELTPKAIDHAAAEVFATTVNDENSVRLSNYKVLGLLFCLLLIVSLVKYFMIDLNTLSLSVLKTEDNVEKVNLPLLVEQPLPTPDVKLIHQQLISAWGLNIKKQVDSFDELCDVVFHKQLGCLKLANITLEEVISLNRIGILSLLNDSGIIQKAILVSINDSDVTLRIDNELRTLSIIDFLLRWEKDYQLLWEQPSGYKKPVLKDSINKPFVDWLLVSLREALETPERLITAGRYTEAVVQQVKQFQVLHQLTSDGVVGAKTIIHLQNYKSGQGRLNKTNVDVGST